MKLLNLTTTYILILILTVLSLWSVYFYFSIKNEFYENIDEYLNNRKHEIIQDTKVFPELLKYTKLPKVDFRIEEINQKQFKNIHETFSDIEIFEPLEKENEPFRKLKSKFSREGKFYELNLVASLLDTEELIDTIRNGVIVLYVILVLLMLFFNRLILQKLWKPFYVTLQNLKKYRLDNDHTLTFDKTNISEFRELNLTIADLIEKNYKAFHDQKQFIENASHEIQTPLAIASGKLELLIQQENLSQIQADIIQSVNQNLERLSSLNKSLLLLSKIDNMQFPQQSVLELGEMLTRLVEDFRPFALFKNIQLDLIIKGKPDLSADRDLIEVMFRNLIKNAIYHNFSGGFVRIEMEKSKIIFENSGIDLLFDPENLFGRFSKESSRPDSQGLGLSIVKSIVTLYNLRISYTQAQKVHKIILTF